MQHTFDMYTQCCQEASAAITTTCIPSSGLPSLPLPSWPPHLAGIPACTVASWPGLGADFSPTTPDKRTFDTMDYATFWITLVISITTYYLAASLVDLGG